MLCFHAVMLKLHSILIAEKVVDDFHWILVSSGNKKVRRQWWTLDSTRRLWIQELFSELPCVPQDFYFEIVGLGHRRNETVSRTISWKLESGWREGYEVVSCNKLRNRLIDTDWQASKCTLMTVRMCHFSQDESRVMRCHESFFCLRWCLWWLHCCFLRRIASVAIPASIGLMLFDTRMEVLLFGPRGLVLGNTSLYAEWMCTRHAKNPASTKKGDIRY